MKKIFLVALLFGVSVAYPQKVSFKVKVYGHGDPVILIPGLGCSGDVWKETVNEFKDHYKLYVLTLPGFAGVRSVDTPIIKTVKDQLISYVKEKHLEKPILMGHSLGGFLSLWAASEDPDLFSKVICADGFPFLPAATDPSVTVEEARNDPGYNAEAVADKYTGMPDNAFAASRFKWALAMVKDSANAKIITKWNMKSNRKALAYAYTEMCTTDLRNEIAKINIPVLVLGSTYGTAEASKKIMEGQFKNLPHKMIVIAPTRHFIMLDDPAWFKEQVKNFLVNGLYN
ncbi:MAG TPA: alpha/beta hydrolase [Chitinophagaceae bacterium]|nr:alpha/beta hydrolase [Chitinophagaceae bacterium]